MAARLWRIGNSGNNSVLATLQLWQQYTNCSDLYVVMNSEEKSTDNMEEEEDEEKPFFKAAFDHFDWNHSSTIPTSVRNSNTFLWTNGQ